MKETVKAKETVKEKPRQETEQKSQQAPVQTLQQKQSPLMWVLVVGLGLLLVFSAVQAVELAGLKETVNSGVMQLSVASQSNSASAPASASSGTTLERSIENLPAMVGGC